MDRKARIAGKLTKIDPKLEVNFYDNGYMVEVSGQDEEGNWKTARLLCVDEAATLEFVKTLLSFERVD